MLFEKDVSLTYLMPHPLRVTVGVEILTFEGLYPHCEAFRNPTAYCFQFSVVFLLYVLLVCRLDCRLRCILNTQIYIAIYLFIVSGFFVILCACYHSVVSFLLCVPFQRLICFLLFALRSSGKEFTYSSLSLCQLLLLLLGIFLSFRIYFFPILMQFL